ncbi:hypothetical protein BCR35DRAFT_94314 [Leucosporidium creatinivorum]|uniref:BTB domain-containing protein n=1 Tax=Leucosporidium creatinivorum TaxID=106004 RepID=A0A1Y2F7A4_9BASI|nr:hypothetical protein BCR35DRAFT_94314 [Leucosporidium creatinivorum]
MDVEADFRHDKLRIATGLPLGLPGQWSLVAYRPTQPLHEVAFALCWDQSLIGAAEAQAMKTAVEVRFEAMLDSPSSLSKVPKCVRYKKAELKGRFPLSMNGALPLFEIRDSSMEKLEPAVNLKTHRSWRVTLDFKTTNMAVVTRPQAALAAGAVSSSVTSRSSTDVRLVFPEPNLELWTTKSTLCDASSYFKKFFEAEIVEPTSTPKGKRRKLEGPLLVKAELEPAEADLEDLGFEDADEEIDAIYSEEGQAMADPGDAQYTEITIPATIASYSTYRALLTWLTTSHIDFAPVVVSSKPATASRKDQLKRFRNANPLLPIPVSPKSVYRLASTLNIPLLQSRAIEGYKLELSAEHVA